MPSTSVSSRISQREATVGTPSTLRARVSSTRGWQAPCRKSCAASPTVRSGSGRPIAVVHRPAEPGPGVGRRRPDAVVQPGQDHQVGALDARLARAPDGDARMRPLGRRGGPAGRASGRGAAPGSRRPGRRRRRRRAARARPMKASSSCPAAPAQISGPAAGIGQPLGGGAERRGRWRRAAPRRPARSARGASAASTAARQAAPPGGGVGQAGRRPRRARGTRRRAGRGARSRARWRRCAPRAMPGPDERVLQQRRQLHRRPPARPRRR